MDDLPGGQDPLRHTIVNTRTNEEDNFMRPYGMWSATFNPFSSQSISDSDHVRAANHINIESDTMPVASPLARFDDLDQDGVLYKNYLQPRGIYHPTSIQMQAINCLLSGRDVIALSPTGSGKSLAYVIPLYYFLRTRIPQRVCRYPQALILVPTRELMSQILSLCQDMISNVNQISILSSTNNKAEFRVMGVCGGVPVSKDRITLKNSVDVIVATPGRLLHLINLGDINLGSVSYFVLDECDNMLDLGMEEQLRTIVALTTSTLIPRQSSLWSATLPGGLQRLARSSVLNPVKITVGLGGDIPPHIQQEVIPIHNYQKSEMILKVIRGTPYPPVLVFCNTIQGVDDVVDLLKKEQFHVAGLHSGKEQSSRFKIMSALKSHEVDVVVATDVASRGIDVPYITHIVNYDLPTAIEGYIHRCGRTGRNGQQGYATSFLTLDCKIAKELKSLLESHGCTIPIELQETNNYGKKVLQTDFGDRVIE